MENYNKEVAEKLEDADENLRNILARQRQKDRNILKQINESFKK